MKCGSSQLNNKLGKMKSTANLFGDFKGALKKGETIEQYILRQKPKEVLNLEDIINES